jgi:autotransporter-associated beta strand protein
MATSRGKRAFSLKRASVRRRGGPARCLVVERLEDRLILATHIWTGATSNLWSLASNWTGGSPFGDTSATLVFPASGALNRDNVNNIPGNPLTIASISIDGSGYNITGNAIQLQGGISGTFTSKSSTFAPDIDITFNISTFQSLSSDPVGLNITGNITLDAPTKGVPVNLQLDGPGQLALSGTISGVGVLQKSGSGTATVSGNNSYSGGTNVLAGTLIVGGNTDAHGGALGASTSAVIVGDNSGTADAALVIGGPYTIARDVTVLAGSSGTMTLGGATADSSTFSGKVALKKPTTFTSVVGGTTTFSGTILGSGDVTASGGGTIVLAGTNSYTGATSVLAGTLAVDADAPTGANGALGNATSAVLVGDVSGWSSASLVISGPYTIGRDVTVQAGSAGTITLGGFTADSSTFFGTTTLNRDATVSTASGGMATFAAPIVGSGGVTVAGSGTIVFASGNVYAGSTTISSGSLIVTGSTDSNGSVTVDGVLAGTGSVGNVTSSAGSTDPGTFYINSGVGILTASSASYSDTANVTMQVTGYGTAGTDFDRLNLGSGALNLSGNTTLTLDVSGLTSIGLVGGLITYGSETGGFSSVNLINNPTGLVAKLVYGPAGLDVYLYYLPVATPQTITLTGNGQASITFTGNDPEAPGSSLLEYTVTSLPSAGTLVTTDGSPVAVGASFMGNAVLTYTLPTEVMGDFSTSFTFTATALLDPPGWGFGRTSAPATISIQTPANSAGVLRITGATGNDNFTLSTAFSPVYDVEMVHIADPVLALGMQIPISALTAVEVFGLGGTDIYNVTTAIGVPVSIMAGNGKNFLTSVATNLTFTGGTGTNIVTATTSSGPDSVVLYPSSGTLTGADYTISLSSITNINVNANASVSVSLYDSSGNDRFTARPSQASMVGTGFGNRVFGAGSIRGYSSAGGSDTANLLDATGANTFTAGTGLATFKGTGLDEEADGFATVLGFAASGTSDTAYLSDASGSNTFSASPTVANFYAPSFLYQANNFASVVANAHSGTSDTAYLFDTTGANTFNATPTTASFIGGRWLNTANGFTTVVATAAGGTTDSATLSDTSGSNCFSASPAVSTFFGTGFFNQARKFGSVTAESAADSADTAYLFDASGSNTFTATPTTAMFMGTGLSESANKFARVYGLSASGTTDSANFSDSVSQPGTFTQNPTYSTMSGTGYFSRVYGFVTVSATAANKSDVANLFDDALGALFAGDGGLGSLTGPSYTINVAQYGTVNINGASGASNKYKIVSAVAYALTKVGNWTEA